MSIKTVLIVDTSFTSMLYHKQNVEVNWVNARGFGDITFAHLSHQNDKLGFVKFLQTNGVLLNAHDADLTTSTLQLLARLIRAQPQVSFAFYVLSDNERIISTLHPALDISRNDQIHMFTDEEINLQSKIDRAPKNVYWKHYSRADGLFKTRET